MIPLNFVPFLAFSRFRFAIHPQAAVIRTSFHTNGHFHNFCFSTSTVAANTLSVHFLYHSLRFLSFSPVAHLNTAPVFLLPQETIPLAFPTYLSCPTSW